MSTIPDPDVPRRALAPAHRNPGRPSAPIQLLPARLVVLAPEHERAALAALAALLAQDYDHDDTTTQGMTTDESGDLHPYLD